MNSAQIRAWGYALLMSLTTIGCSADKEPVEAGAGGSVSTSTNVGGKSGVGGSNTSNTGTNTKATGGASTSVGGAGTVTGGAPNTGAGGTSAVTTTGLGGGNTGGEPNVGGTTSTAPMTYTISGTITGLEGTGLQLSMGSGMPLAISQNGPFAFPTAVVAGSAVNVVIYNPPNTPLQACTVANGTIASMTQNVSNVTVSCVTETFTIGGTVTGLIGGGLVLQNNGGNNLTIVKDGAFTFPAPVLSGGTYTVGIAAQPTSPVQECVLSGQSGTVGTGNVTSVTVNCSTKSFVIGGTVEGLAGTGLVLQNNGGDDVPVTGNGGFSFPTPILSGAPFAVTVKTQPSGPAQTCALTSATGNVGSSAVSTVSVSCTTNKYKVKGTVTGLAGTGLVLQNNLGDNLPIAADGPFAFPLGVASGATYSVTVQQQPNQPAQDCVVTAASGTIASADVADVAVTCSTSSFTVGGTVVGLVGTGLVLQNNSADDITLDADGPFAFNTKIASGSPFAITVKTAPEGVFCSVSGGKGTMGSGPVNATINCSDQAHSVSGTVTGLLGKGLRVALNGGNVQSVFGDQFAFTDLIAKDGTYEVTITKQPTTPSQTCSVTNGSGTMASAEVTDVQITCVTNTYVVGGTVTGLKGTGLVLQNKLGDDVTITPNGDQPVAFTFPTEVASGASYSATVKTPPTSPLQDCTITNATGTVGGAAVSSIQVACTTKRFTVGGTVTGLLGTLVLSNKLDSKNITTEGPFTFDQTMESGDTFNIAVVTQPTVPSQTCTVVPNTGSVVDANINVAVTCVTNTFSIGGSVIGLANGQSLTLKNGEETLVVSTPDFAFLNKVASGQGYSVSLVQGPTTQDCTISGNEGIVGGENIAGVTVNCTNKPTVGGTVSELHGSGLVLTLTVGTDEEDLPVSASPFTFLRPFENGESYTVTVKTNPTAAWQTCTVSNDTGTIANNTAATNVLVSCVRNPFTVKVRVTGLAATASVMLQNNSGDNLTVPGTGAAIDTAFATQVGSGLPYKVTVGTHPTGPSQTCTVTSDEGTIGNADVTVDVGCVTDQFYVGGKVTGVADVSGLKLLNGTEELSPSSSGAFKFLTKIDSGAPYAVTIIGQPAGLTCTLANASGNVGDGDVTTILVKCPPALNFDTDDTQGWQYPYNAPTGYTVTWNSTAGAPNPGSVSAYLPYTPATWDASAKTGCPSSTNIAVSLATPVDTSAFTTMSMYVRVDGAWPNTDRSGVFFFFIEDNDGTFNNSSTFVGGTNSYTSWWTFGGDVTGGLGVWKQFTWNLPTDANLDRTNIKKFGLNIFNHENDPSKCQATTILIDSVTFQ